MRRVLIILLTVFYVNHTSAQTEEVGGAIVGAIVAGLATAIAVDQVIDQLEWRATEFVLATRPEVTEFVLDNLKLSNDHIWDHSAAQYIPFGLTYFIDGKYYKELIIMTCSPNWINDYGLDYSKISYEIMTRDTVLSMFFNFINMASPIVYEDLNSIYEVRNEEPRKSRAEEYDIVKMPYGTYYVGREAVPILNLRIRNRSAAAKLSDGSYRKIVEFRNYGEDAYKATDLDENFKVIYHKNDLGLFHKKNRQLTAIKTNALNKIIDFFEF